VPGRGTVRRYPARTTREHPSDFWSAFWSAFGFLERFLTNFSGFVLLRKRLPFLAEAFDVQGCFCVFICRSEFVVILAPQASI
jgi:hypothetical protein